MPQSSRETEDLNEEQKAFLSSYFDDSLFAEDDNLKAQIQKLQARYTDHLEINSGGMKKIFSCTDQSTGRKVAKAVLKDGCDQSSEQAELVDQWYACSAADDQQPCLPCS